MINENLATVSRLTPSSIPVKIVEPDSEGIGEIALTGDNIMKGYYKEPEKTAEVIQNGYFYMLLCN